MPEPGATEPPATGSRPDVGAGVAGTRAEVGAVTIVEPPVAPGGGGGVATRALPGTWAPVVRRGGGAPGAGGSATPHLGQVACCASAGWLTPHPGQVGTVMAAMRTARRAGHQGPARRIRRARWVLDNRTVEARLTDIARVLDLRGENPFKVRAYENAARAIASLEDDISVVVRERRLSKIPGIGQSIGDKVTELVETGKLAYLEEIKQGIPPGVFELLRVQGLGPKKTKALWEQLGVTSLEALDAACRQGRVAGLKGFGDKTQEKILAGLALLSRTKDRALRSDALPEARALVEGLRQVKGVQSVELAGSIRRGRETVKDVDILVGGTDAAAVMAAFVARPEVQDVIATGPTKTSVHVKSGLQVDVRVVQPDQFACALAYFTGSKEFNVALRGLALEQGYTLNEYALRPLDGSPPPALATEAELFARLGLAYVEPELRENTGEIDAAQKGTLPRLIEPKDLKGILHCHTTWSDGAHSVEEMVAEAEALGYAYIGISDHSANASYARGLDAGRLAQQRAEVEAARLAHPKILVLHGVEADIMPDGSLDLGEEVLSQLDFVIASVHQDLTMKRDAMTARMVRAVSHPLVRVLGHPLGRRLLEREDCEFDWEPVIAAAGKNDVAIEVNGTPKRLDADWKHIRRVRAKGVKLCLNPDAHSVSTVDDARLHAITEARRGWTTPEDVVNTLPADQFVARFLRNAEDRRKTMRLSPEQSQLSAGAAAIASALAAPLVVQGLAAPSSEDDGRVPAPLEPATSATPARRRAKTSKTTPAKVAATKAPAARAEPAAKSKTGQGTKAKTGKKAEG